MSFVDFKAVVFTLVFCKRPFELSIYNFVIGNQGLIMISEILDVLIINLFLILNIILNYKLKEKLKSKVFETNKK